MKKDDLITLKRNSNTIWHILYITACGEIFAEIIKSGCLSPGTVRRISRPEYYRIIEKP